jgi:hypothetical protein
MMQDVSAIEDGDRHEVQQTEVEADGRHQREERDPACGATHPTAAQWRLVPSAGAGGRADEQAAERLEDQAAELDIR